MNNTTAKNEVPVNGTWRWSDIAVVREKGDYLPCWCTVWVDGGPWIENPALANPALAKKGGRR